MGVGGMVRQRFIWLFGFLWIFSAFAGETSGFRPRNGFSPEIIEAADKDVQNAAAYFKKVYAEQPPVNKILPKTSTLVDSVLKKVWSYSKYQYALPKLPKIDAKILFDPSSQEVEIPGTGYAGGRIHIVSDDFNFLGTVDGLAFSLAHETAHFTLAHIETKYFFEKKHSGKLPEGFNEALEVEADRVATFALAELGYNPHAGIDVLQAFMRNLNAKGELSRNLRQPLEQRISKLEELLETEGLIIKKSVGDDKVREVLVEITNAMAFGVRVRDGKSKWEDFKP